MPMPGSPPTSVREPCTIPPPRTLSSSPIPVEKRASSPTVTSDSTAGATLSLLSETAEARPPADALLTLSSTNVFHSLQPGHCPIHLEDSYPQFWQKKTVVFLPFAIFSLSIQKAPEAAL